MYPDILNYDKLVEILGDFKAPMGCRSFYQVGKMRKVILKIMVVVILVLLHLIYLEWH